MNSETLLALSLKWLALLAPPLMLLPLAVIPPDFGTSLFWFIGGVFFVISLFKIIRLALIKVTRRATIYPVIVRPLMTVCVFLLCLLSIKVSLQQARTDAIEAAQDILTLCQAHDCPIVPPGWTPPDNMHGAPAQRVGLLAQYPLLYRLGDDAEKFTLYLYVNMDSGYMYEVKSDGVIHEVYQCC